MADDILLGVKVQGDQATGFFRVLAAGAQGAAEAIRGIGPAFAGVAQGIQALSQLEKARQAATAGAFQELQVLQQQIAIQSQVRAGTLTLADATQKLAEAEIFAKTGNQQLAAELAAVRTAHQQNTAALQAEAAAQQALKAAQTSAKGEIAELQAKVAVQKQVLAGTISLEQGTRKLAEAEILAKTGSQQLASQLANLRAQADRNQQSITQLGQGARTAAGSMQLLQTALGALGIATGVTALLATLKAIVAEGIRYNATLETQKIGLASIITSQQNIRNAQGRTLDGAEKFTAAQVLASGLMKQIQKDALLTTATTEQLVEAFQSALGPLSAAGLSLDQSREATLRIVQAASALGIPMHQVAQEVRAIAEGSIDVNARLAKALGITNEIVKAQREQGTLFDFIIEKTKAFALAGDATQRSFSGIVSSLQDVGSQIAAKSLATPFDQLKARLNDVLLILLEVNKQLDEASTKPLPGSGGIEQTSPQVVTPQLNEEQIKAATARVKTFLNEVSQSATLLAAQLQRTSNVANNVGGIIHGALVAAFSPFTDRTLGDGVAEVRSSFRQALTTIGDGMKAAGESSKDLTEQTKGFVTQFAEVRDASRITWKPLSTDLHNAAIAADALGQAFDRFTSSPPNLGPTTEQLKEMAKLSRDATSALDKLQETAARQAGDVGAFRQAQEDALAHDLSDALAEATKKGITDLASIYEKFDAQRRQNELAYISFVIEQGEKQTQATLSQVDARLTAQRASHNSTLDALGKEIEQLQALQQEAERAGEPLSAQGELLAEINQKQAIFHATALRAGQEELTILRERLVVLEKTRAGQQAQANQFQGKQDIVSLAQLKKLNEAIAKTTNQIVEQRAVIQSASDAVASAQSDIATTEIQRGEAQVALTQKYLEEEAKRTQFAQEQVQARADLELQGVQQRIDAITNQQGLEAATLRLREQQGAGLEELADREKSLIGLSQRRAQEAIRAAEIELKLQQDKLDILHETIAAQQQDFGARFSAGDIEGARAVASALKDSSTEARTLAVEVEKAKGSLDNAKGSANALGIEGAAAVAKLRHELELSRAVLTTNDARNIFEDLLDVDSLKDAGKLLQRESRNISKQMFTDLLFGKKSNFDEPLISNVNGLFGAGDGGLLGKIMFGGGKVQGEGWGNAVTTASQQILRTGLPTAAQQATAAAHGVFLEQGKAAGTVFGENCLTGFEDTFGDGIGGVLDGVFQLIGQAFGSGGSAGGGGSGGGIDTGGLFDLFGGMFGSAGETSATSFNSGFLGNFGQGFGDLGSTVDASSVNWSAAGSSSGSAFGGGFMDTVSGIFGGGGAGGGAGGGLMGLFGGGGGAGGAGTSGASSAGSWFGLGMVGAQIGQDFSKGNYGAGAGGVVGGALGAYFSGGNPQITAAAAQLGAQIGGIFDKIFNEQGRIDKEKGKIIKYFEKVFDVDFKKITEKKAAAGLEEFANATPAALALGAIFSEGLKKGDAQGSTVRFAGQLLGNLRKMGDGADEVKEKLLELADAANFDLHDSITQINQFTKETGADALTLGNFQEELREAKKNLKEYGDTSGLTAAQLTDLAAAHGNTGSQIVTYTTLIGGAIDIGLKFNEFLDGQVIAQGLAAQSFLDAATAAGSTGQAVTDLADKVRAGNLSLEEAALELNSMREAAGQAKLSLDDLTIDPKKLEVMVAVLQSATEGLQNFSAGLTDALAAGLGQKLDEQGAGARFDEFMNATLRVAVTKAMIGGMIDSLQVEALAPFFTALGAEFTNLVTGAIDADEFGRRIAAIQEQFGPAIDAAKAGFVEVDKTIRDVLTSLGLWPEAVDETTDTLADTQQSLAEIHDKIKAIDEQLLDIARRKIHVEIDLATKLESIGAITLLEKLDIESAGLQQEFDLLTEKLRAMGDAAGLSVAQLGEAISLVQQLAANVVAKFQAEKAAIEAALATTIAAIRARGEAEADAIRAAFAAQRAAIEARIDALEDEKDAINEAFDARREALEKELQLAREFQRVGESIQQTINNLITSNVAPISPFAQLSFLQRQAAQLRAQLETAAPEDVPALMQQLTALLQQMAQLQTPNSRPSPEFQALFNSILAELEQLRAEALARGAGADSLEEELRQLDIDRNAALDAIDAQIETARAQLDGLSALEQAALAAAAAGIEAEIAAAQAAADAKIDELRDAAEAELRRLADVEKELLSRQEGLLLTERDILVAQLTELERLNITAANLLSITAAGYGATPPGRGQGGDASSAAQNDNRPFGGEHSSPPPPPPGWQSILSDVPQFLRESMQVALRAPAPIPQGFDTPPPHTAPDIARPERIETAPARTEPPRTASESPREVKLVFEVKASVEVTGAHDPQDAAKKVAVSLKPLMEAEMRKFARSDYMQNIIRGQK